MSNKSCCRRLFAKQQCKRCQTLLKSSRQHLYHIYWSVWKDLSRKKSLLVISKILAVFVQSLTDDDKYSLLKRDNLMRPIQVEWSNKQKHFWEFFSAFLKSRSIFEHFGKRMTVTTYVFPKFRTAKDVLT